MNGKNMEDLLQKEQMLYGATQSLLDTYPLETGQRVAYWTKVDRILNSTAAVQTCSFTRELYDLMTQAQGANMMSASAETLTSSTEHLEINNKVFKNLMDLSRYSEALGTTDRLNDFIFKNRHKFIDMFHMFNDERALMQHSMDSYVQQFDIDLSILAIDHWFFTSIMPFLKLSRKYIEADELRQSTMSALYFDELI